MGYELWSMLILQLNVDDDFFILLLMLLMLIFFILVLQIISIFMLNFQRDGMSIQAERLNFHRYISHFRSVHRGSSFAKMRTTSVRKLLPEYVILAWHSIVVF